jgi:hypothetical protein
MPDGDDVKKCNFKFNLNIYVMWSTESLWFEVAIVSMIYAFGNILMGQFEERTPKLRRVGKYILTLLIICAISFFFGRIYAMTLLAVFIIPLLYVHGYFLPRKKGINGWTGEPKSKYYEFRKWDKNIFSK